MKRLSKLTLFITALFTLSLASVPVYAQHGLGDNASEHQDTVRPVAAVQHDNETENETEAHNGTDDTNKPAAGAKLEAAKLRICQNRTTKIKAITTHLADRGQKQADLFGTIATRVENFYVSKGKTLDTYDNLVAAVNAKHDAALSAIATLRNGGANFTCNTNQGPALKADVKAEIQALKDYRTAVKNLIVGVKSVTGTTKSATGGSQ